MLKHILPVIPNHKIYIEPFFGGGAVFWAKEPSKIEIINDINASVINFYKVLKHRFNDLQKAVKSTLHSRDTYKHALIIYHAPYLFNEVQRAWAFWVTANMGYAGKIGYFGYHKDGKMEKSIMRRREEFKDIYSKRLECVQIENNDSLQVIRSRDNEDAFIYADPPYVGADQGHYGGYTQEHFNALLDTLAAVKGRFLLSSYPNDVLSRYTKLHGWFQKDVNMQLCASGKRGRKKVECLTANYPI